MIREPSDSATPGLPRYWTVVVVLHERDLVPRVGAGQPGLVDRAAAPQGAVVHRDGDARARCAHAVGVGGDALQDVGAVGDRGGVPATDPSVQGGGGPRDHPVVHEATREHKHDLGHVGRRHTGIEKLEARLGRPVRGEEHRRGRWRDVDADAGRRCDGDAGSACWRHAGPGGDCDLRQSRQAGDREQARNGARHTAHTAQPMRPSSTDLRNSPHETPSPLDPTEQGPPVSRNRPIRTDVTPRRPIGLSRSRRA